MQRPKDYIHVRFPVAGGSVIRAWSVELPRVSISCALKAQITSVIGPVADEIAARLFGLDEELQADREREGLTGRTIDDAVIDAACALYRNARAGRALRGLAGYETGAPEEALEEVCADGAKRIRIEPGVDMSRAASMLSLVISRWLPKFGAQSDIERLFGKVEEGGLNTGLLWALLYHSNLTLTLDTGGKDTRALNDLKASGMGPWAAAMDDYLVSDDEFFLLCAFAFLHLWRPF